MHCESQIQVLKHSKALWQVAKMFLCPSLHIWTTGRDMKAGNGISSSQVWSLGFWIFHTQVPHQFPLGVGVLECDWGWYWKLRVLTETHGRWDEWITRLCFLIKTLLSPPLVFFLQLSLPSIMPSFSFTAVVNPNIMHLQCAFETLRAHLMALTNSISEDHPNLMLQKEAWSCDWVKVVVGWVNHF
jgi:hypothetical protein